MSEILEPEKFYHIFNHANGDDLLFKTKDNYYYFLKKYLRYIVPIADTYAYCLMPNHFHLLVKIKALEDISTFPKYKTFEKGYSFEKVISKQFSNLFSSYTLAYNKLNNRYGSLFIKNFKRKHISSEMYLRQVTIYIHNNPIKHEFVEKPEDWKYSSFSAFLTNKTSLIQRELVLSWFEDLNNFKYCHEKQKEIIEAMQLED